MKLPPIRDGSLRAQQSQSTPEATSKKSELAAMGRGGLLGCWDQRALCQLCRGPAATTYSSAPSKCGSSAEAGWLGRFSASGKALRKVGKGFTGLSLQPSGPGVLCSPEGLASARAPFLPPPRSEIQQAGGCGSCAPRVPGSLSSGAQEGGGNRTGLPRPPIWRMRLNGH